MSGVRRFFAKRMNFFEAKTVGTFNANKSRQPRRSRHLKHFFGSVFFVARLGSSRLPWFAPRSEMFFVIARAKARINPVFADFKRSEVCNFKLDESGLLMDFIFQSYIPLTRASPTLSHKGTTVHDNFYSDLFVKPCHPESVENEDSVRNFQAVQDLTKT